MSDGETPPEYDLTTVDYESDFLQVTDREEWRDVDSAEFDADVDPELSEGYEPAIRYLMGDEWVDENLDLGESMSESNDSDTYDPTEAHSETTDDVGGQVVVGKRDLDVPELFDGWTELEFIADSIKPEPTRGTEAVYLGPERRYSVVVEGTIASNKWGIRAYAHEEPIPRDADYNEMRYGPGGADSESESWHLTHGNVVDGSAEAMLDAELPTREEVVEHFQGADDQDEADKGPDVNPADVETPGDWFFDAETWKAISFAHPENKGVVIEDQGTGTFETYTDTPTEVLVIEADRSTAIDAAEDYMEQNLTDEEYREVHDVGDEGDGEEPAGRAEPLEFVTLKAATGFREE